MCMAGPLAKIWAKRYQPKLLGTFVPWPHAENEPGRMRLHVSSTGTRRRVVPFSEEVRVVVIALQDSTGEAGSSELYGLQVWAWCVTVAATATAAEP